MTADASAVPEPLVSIIVNNYNYATFLGEAINSALDQTYPLIEVVVVDDGSSDESREVIASFGGRITPVLKENGGQASAFNAGFAVSTGDVILFLDSDDVLLPSAVARAVELFAEPGVIKVHWPLWKTDVDGHRTGRVQPPRVLEDGDISEAVIRDGPNAGSSTPTSGNAWSRSFLERVLPAPEPEWRISADGYLVTLAWVCGKVRAIQEPQGLYRLHGNNHFASKSWQKRRELRSVTYLRRCDALASHLARLGIQADAESWKRADPQYMWPKHVQATKEQIASVALAGHTVILIDDNGQLGDLSGDELIGRRLLPFLERDGQYWGQPESDTQAIDELERLRQGGADFIAIPWFARWWQEYYPEFAEHLRARFACVIETDQLLVYDLRRP